MIWNVFKPFLQEAFECINCRNSTPAQLKDFFDDKSMDAFVQNMSEFDNKEFLEDDHRHQQYFNFASEFVQTSVFTNFMCGYLDEELTNFDVAIRMIYSESMDNNYKDPNIMHNRFHDQLRKAVNYLSDEDKKKMKHLLEIRSKSMKQLQSSNSKVDMLQFRFRLPSYTQRLMLFE